MLAASDPPFAIFTIRPVRQGALFVMGCWQLEHKPSCRRQTRYSFRRPLTEFSNFLPHRVSKYCSHCRSCGLASARILICRWIGVSDSNSKVSVPRVPPINPHEQDPIQTPRELLQRICSIHPPTQEATAVKLWRNAQRVSSEALTKEDTLRRVPPKTQKGPRL